MSDQMYHIEIGGEQKQYAQGTTYLDIAKEYQKEYPDDIVLAVFVCYLDTSYSHQRGRSLS